MNYINNVNHSNQNWDEIEYSLLVVGLHRTKKFTNTVKLIDDVSSGLLSEAIKIGDVKGKRGESHLFYVKGRRVLLLGLGNEEKFDSKAMRMVAGRAMAFARDKKFYKIVVECFSDKSETYQAFGEGIVLGSYQYLEHKTNKESSSQPLMVTILGCSHPDLINEGVHIGSAVCFARDLGNGPGNISTPSKLAESAEQIANEGDMTIKVFDREDFTIMGMGGIAGVARGTDEPPKFIVLEYMKGGDEKPKILVGKGLTFDSGGISIKPATKMDEMKFDMCGSAVVLGVFKALATTKPDLNVVGIIPATENLNGSKAYKPGDILKAYNGKTIEVLNTDAEGRLILADGLSYASKHYNPEYILDFATLTGAVIVALGHEATGIMGTDDNLIKKIIKASKKTNEKVWELPLWPEYCEQIKSQIADVKNMGAPMQAGTIAAGAFLKEFVSKDIPWVHFDIAGTAWGSKPNSINPKGSASGWGIRLVLEMLKQN